jgi:hypothetical protein
MPLDLTSAASVRETFLAGSSANLEAPCRQGSIDRVSAPGRLIATGDLHDNPLHFARLVRAAGLDDQTGDQETERRRNEERPEQSVSSSLGLSVSSPSHLVLHEIIHSDRLINGMDFSFRALARVAALKSAYPDHVHTLLANHELAQLTGAGIIKDGVKVVEAFNEGVEYAFGDEAEPVQESIREFIYSMPLALRARCQTQDGRSLDILCAHSLPSTAMMSRFDPTVLSRDLTPADYEPRQGAAHIMVWGRGYDAEQLEDLVERWGVNMFILGHEKADTGVQFIPPCAIVLNSDHERGVYLPIDLDNPPSPEEAAWMIVPLAAPE